MSVYNSEKYLVEAIESILNQTYTNFEFIIVNDGSIDSSLDIIQEYMKKDERIVLISRDNKGLPHSLNEGIEKAKGKYIARMDADDISLSTRFEEQVKFMEDNKIDVCGSYVQIFGSSRTTIWEYPKTHNEIEFTLISMTSFAHPTVMMKKEIFNNVKYSDYKTAQDYKLWTDIVLAGYKCANIDKVLLNYRMHDGQVTSQKRVLQKQYTYEISKFFIENSKFKTYPQISKLFEFRQQANYQTVLDFLYELVAYAKEHKISNNVLLKLVRFIFRTFTPMSPILLFAYFKVLKNIKKSFKSDLSIIMQSLFFLSNNGKIFLFIRKFVK